MCSVRPLPRGIHSNVSAEDLPAVVSVLPKDSRAPRVSGDCRALVLKNEGTEIRWGVLFQNKCTCLATHPALLGWSELREREPRIIGEKLRMILIMLPLLHNGEPPITRCDSLSRHDLTRLSPQGSSSLQVRLIKVLT